MTISVPSAPAAMHYAALLQIVLCCCVLTAPPIIAAEFLGVGPISSPLNAQAVIGDLSADGSTIIGIDYVDASTERRGIYRWTRDTGKNFIDSPADFRHDGGLTHFLSADGSVVETRIERLINGEPDARGGIWTQDTGWQLPGPAPPFYPGSSFSALSADGSTAVGWDGQAVRWTMTGGYENLGPLPGQTYGAAFDVSGDGSVIVGISGQVNAAGNIQALSGPLFRWTSTTGMVSVGELPAGHNFWAKAPNVSEDGSTLSLGAKRTGETTGDVYRWKSDTGLVAIIPDVPQTCCQTLHISSDGSVVVAGGYNGLQRWTEQAGLQLLPPLYVGANTNVPLSMSADGSMIFGLSISQDPGQPVSASQLGFWSADGIVKTLQQVLQEQGLGTSIQGWQFPTFPGFQHYFLSADGRVLAGPGINPNGRTEAFIVYLDPLVVPEPTTAALVLLTVTWSSLFRMWRLRRGTFTSSNGSSR